MQREPIFEVDWDREGRISVVNQKTKSFTISGPSENVKELSVGSLSEILVYLSPESNILTFLRKTESVNIEDIVLVYKDIGLQEVKWAMIEQSNTQGVSLD